MIHRPFRTSPIHDAHRLQPGTFSLALQTTFTASRLLDRGALCYVVLPRNCEESTLRSAQDLGARSEPGADLGARSEPGAPAQDLGARSEPGT
ncbi:BZ3501_MvSof-1269-A2-R1_C46g00234 [Microbotryum saponariae]|nr:BZ3501_MvSof-1269-A2-R1_Chr10-2g02395 [Microbotryum saponariae]SCZ88905.1 BZ3501_MvSof-1269-A2-R1_C46g00234 [Microbotryum saponariae]